MLFGHNSNVKVGEATFHVQTEDRGVTTALIDTTVYYMGRVMHRRTNNYHDLIPLNPDREEALRLRLDEQHRSTLEDIRSGALYLAAPPPPAAAPADKIPSRPITGSAPVASNAPGDNKSTGASSPNGANAVILGGAAVGLGASTKDLAPPSPSALKLELRNAQSWLSGKQARLEISVATPTGEPLAGAKVSAYIEGAATLERFSAQTDSAGNTQIIFDMPKLTGGQVALVIEAERDHGAAMSRTRAQGKLRFALRTKPRPA